MNLTKIEVNYTILMFYLVTKKHPMGIIVKILIREQLQINTYKILIYDLTSTHKFSLHLSPAL